MKLEKHCYLKLFTFLGRRSQEHTKLWQVMIFTLLSGLLVQYASMVRKYTGCFTTLDTWKFG